MRPSIISFACCALIILVGACGNNGGKPAGSVAAKVNGTEITTGELTAVMGRGGNVASEQAVKAAPQVLEQIINQQLLVQQALESKLDRDPGIVQAVDSARKQILAQAYVQKTMAGADKGSVEEIRAFYAGQPALFEQRRIFRFQELAVAANPEQATALRGEAAKARSLNDLAAWLKARSIPFNTNTATKAAEQLPIELLPQIAQMRDGQIAVIPGSHGVAVLQLIQSQPAPLAIEQATPMIEQFLANKKRVELADAEVKRLRDKAKIEYVGDFESTRPSGAAAPPPAATAAGIQAEKR